MEKSGVVPSCGETMVLSASGRRREREVEIGAGDCGSVAGKSGASFAQKCEDVFCFEDVGAVDRDD